MAGRGHQYVDGEFRTGTSGSTHDVVDPATGEERTFEGRCTGTLTSEPRGDGGFGYDPAFVPDADHTGRTMAELTAGEKDAISHRGRAARDFAAWLTQR